MCEFGSTAKSLVSSERKSEVDMHVMSQRFQDRMLGNTNTAAASGLPGDTRSRLKQYREKFCDPHDNNGQLFLLCEHDQDKNLGNSTPGNAAPRGVGGDNTERLNKDVDFLRTVDFPLTLDMDFTDNALTDQEEEIIALGDNLYGHDVFARISGKVFSDGQDEALPASNQALMDARAALAKLGVAYNSYSAITSMKAAGTAGSRDFLEAALIELGIPEDNTNTRDQIDDVRRILGFSNASGDEIGPSYHAQMEVLTKKIYQTPDFYTNLYDKPVNVERKAVAMQAIGLMQKFDLFKSYLRNEANISILLELAVEELQGKAEQKVNEQSVEGLN
jgi:hypothetical protein